MKSSHLFNFRYIRGLPSMSATDEGTIEVCKSKICCSFTIKYQKLTVPKDKVRKSAKIFQQDDVNSILNFR